MTSALNFLIKKLISTGTARESIFDICMCVYLLMVLNYLLNTKEIYASQNVK